MALTQISTAGVKNDAVTAGKIPANAVGSSELADNAVTSTQIADNTIVDGDIADATITLNKLVHGTSSNDGKFLRANNGADPSFETVTSTNIIGNADNRVITGSGTANTLNGESNLTFDGSTLAISGTTSILNSSGNTMLELKRTDTNTAGAHGTLNFTASDGHSVASIGTLGDGDNEGADIVFRTTSAAASNDPFNAATPVRMTIDSSGNVMIGTTSPDKRLTLVDRTDPIALIIGENDNATTDAGLRIQARNTANSSGFNLDIAVDADASAATFDFGGAERMRLDSSGNLQLRNATTSHQAIQFYKDNNLGCSFSYGEGTANPTLNIYRQDAQSGFPYGNLIINTGDGTNPTQALKLRTDKNIELAGNLIMASGKGIDFSATSNATGQTSEVLDDYEEGIYTPEVILGGGQSGVTQPSTRTGSYTKIGDRVSFNIHITGTLSYTGSIYHGIHISLPFNTNSYGYAALAVWFYAGVTDEYKVISRTENADNKLILQYPGDSIAFLRVDGTWNMMISGHYETA